MATAPKRKRVRSICQSCYESENFDDMVNCGKCHEWSHFCCAVVGPKIKDEDWICNRCTEIAAVQDQVQKLQMVQDVNVETVLEEEDFNKGASAIVHETETMKESNAPNVRESIPPNAYQMSMLPTKSLVELQDLLTYVQSANGFSQFKLHISSLCGNDVAKSVRNIVFDVMDIDVQKQLSWSGLRTKKPSFAKKFKRIVDAISETLDEKFKDYNYDILKRKVTTLLQNAEY